MRRACRLLLTDRAPTVSIAIRAYRRRWLGEAIESVLAQTYQDLELVVYDDAGDLEDVVAPFALADSRVRYERAERKLGASGRFSAAVALCRGGYIGLLDDDDRYGPEFVARLAGALDEEPRAGIAFCLNRWLVGDALYMGANGRPGGRQERTARDALTSRLMVPPSRMLIRRQALDDAERAQAMPDGVAPDRWMNVRTAVAGWDHVLVDEPLVTCRWHEDQITRSGRDAYDRALATWAELRLDDAELDAHRRAGQAARLVDRAMFSLREGDAPAARADVRSAAAIDPSAAVRRRRLAGVVAVVPGGAAAFAAARRVKRRFHRRDALPPDVAHPRRGRGEQVARDAATFALGSGAAQAINLLVAPVLTRLFDPAAVGAAGVITGAMLALAPIACLRFEVAIPLARGPGEASALCALCLVVALGVAALVGIVAVLFGSALCDAANVPQMSAYTWLVPLHVAIAAPGLVAVALLTRRRRYNALAGSRLAQTAGQAGTQVSAGAAGVGAAAAWFAGGVTAGAAAASLTGAALARRGAGQLRGLARDGRRGMRDVARKWRRFSGWSAGAVLLGSGGLAAPAIMVAALYGPHAAGLFVLAQRVIALPAAFTAEAVGAAWYGTAAEIVREERGSLRAPLAAVTRMMVLAGGTALVVVLIAGPPLFGPVFGDEWQDAGHLVFALAPLHFSILASAPAGLTLQALGRTDLLTVVSSGRFLAPVAGIAAGDALGWSLTAALGLYAALMVAISAANTTIAWRLSSRG